MQNNVMDGAADDINVGGDVVTVPLHFLSTLSAARDFMVSAMASTQEQNRELAKEKRRVSRGVRASASETQRQGAKCKASKATHDSPCEAPKRVSEGKKRRMTKSEQ